MKNVRKALSVLLALALALGVFTLLPVSVQAAEVFTDTLTVDVTGATRTNYINWTAQKDADHASIHSDAVYAGNSAKGNGGIQMRSKSQSGIVVTGSGGKAASVTVTWVNTYQNDDRYLAVYGSNTAYSSAADLYADSTRGDLLATFSYYDAGYDAANDVYYSELEITGDYHYLGFRSRTGALYLASVVIDWSESDAGRVWDWASDFSWATCTFTNETGVHIEAATITSEVTQAPSYLADGVRTYTAAVVYDGVTYRDQQTAPIPQLVFGGSVPYIDETGTQQDSPAGTVLLAGDEGDVYSGWYTFAADTSVDDLTFHGDVRLVLCDGVTVTVNNALHIAGNSAALTIYGQTDGSGQLAAAATGSNDLVIGVGTLTVFGGTYRWIGKSGYGCVGMDAKNLTVNGGFFKNCTLSADDAVTINGGVVNNDENTNISCAQGTVTVNGGEIELRASGSAVDCNSFVYTGGSFKAVNGLDGFVYSRGESVTLSWTNPSDSIYVGQYGCWKPYEGGVYSFEMFDVTLLSDFVDEDGNEYPHGTYDGTLLRYHTLRPNVDLWNQLQQQINAAQNGDTIQLTGNCFASSDDTALVVPSDIEVLTIDLNGYTIDRGLANEDAIADGNVITNHAIELYIIDTSSKKTGRITGGNNLGNGGGIINDNDTLELDGVTVSGNKCRGNGGGIWSNVVVILKDSTVTENVAGGDGGGIYCSRNTTQNRIYVSGDVNVTDNTDADGLPNNVFFYGSQNFIYLQNALTADARIGISTKVSEKRITSGLSGKGSAENFVSDSEQWLVSLSGNEAKLTKPFVIRFDANGGAGEMENIVTLDASVTMPVCTFTAPEGKRFKAWSDGYGNNNIQEDEEVGLSDYTYEYTIYAVWADLYTVTVADTQNGMVRANKSEAIAGERVRLSALPDPVYQLDHYTVSYGENQTVNVQENSFFTMPAANVTITAVWADLPITVIAHSLCLNGAIGVNFYTYIPDVTDAAYASFTVNGETVTVPIDLSGYTAATAKHNHH